MFLILIAVFESLAVEQCVNLVDIKIDILQNFAHYSVHNVIRSNSTDFRNVDQNLSRCAPYWSCSAVKMKKTDINALLFSSVDPTMFGPFD